MPLKKILKGGKGGKKKSNNVNQNCTKMSSDEIANEGEEEGQDGEGNEFQKATKVFHGYLSRCGLSKVLMGALTELHKNQKDIEDPTQFLKSYLEVASGTGKEFDKLKQIFVELFSALFKVDSAVARVGAELKGAKECIENDLNEIKTAARLAAADAESRASADSETRPPPIQSASSRAAATSAAAVATSTAATSAAAAVGSVRKSSGSGGAADATSIARLTLEERALAEKMFLVEEKLQRLEEANRQMAEVKRTVDDLRKRLDTFGEKMKEGLTMTRVEEVVMAEGEKEEEEEGPEDENGLGKTFGCEPKAGEGEEGLIKEADEASDENSNRKRLARPAGRTPTVRRGNKNKNNDDDDNEGENGEAAKEGKQKTIVKTIQSKVGSKDNEQHKAGGGTTKVFNQKTDYSKVQSKAGANDNIGHKAAGGTTKVFNEKQDYSKVQSKAGANDNVGHKAGGGTTKVFNEKQDHSKVQSKAGANDNIDHKAGGGTTKVFDEKQDYSDVKSKAGANDNIKHKAAGGEKKVFDQKVVYK